MVWPTVRSYGLLEYSLYEIAGAELEREENNQYSSALIE